MKVSGSIPPPSSTLDRFLEKVEKVTEAGCHIWMAALDTSGYGKFKVDGHNRGAHRVAWIMERGPIPDGKQIDHICRVRCCVNVSHLRLITQKENLLCGRGLPALNSRKHLCKRGHPLEGINLEPYALSMGMRSCIICRNMMRRMRYKEKVGE